MSRGPEPQVSPADRVHDIPRILHEMREAVREALAQHRAAGNPVAVWRDGRVEWVRPEDIPVGPAKGSSEER